MKNYRHRLCEQLLFLSVALVLLTEINGKLPKGPLKTMDLTVLEGTTVPLMIYLFTSSNSAVKTFNITDGVQDTLRIEDGLLYLNKTLDRETQAVHKVQIEGLNEKQEVVEGPAMVTIIVQDINDNEPVFVESKYEGIVWQNSRPGKPFMKVEATDLDDPDTLNGQIQYSIQSQLPKTEFDFFQIDKETGKISTTQAGYESLDPLKESEYNVIVAAKDAAKIPLSTNVVVTIAVKENLWKSPGEIDVVENSTGPFPQAITKVQWNKPGAIYELKPKDKRLYPDFPFVIDASGDINVTKPLDREEISEYVLLAFALDNNREQLEDPLEIAVSVKDINDNRPFCQEQVTFLEVQENEQRGSVIGTVIVKDFDEDGTKNSMLKYKIIDQEPKIPAPDMFTIGDYDGNIQRFNGMLEKKNAPDYIIRVQATDQLGDAGGLSTVCVVNISVIDINDKIPIFEKMEYGSITLPETTQLDHIVMEIQATDDDEPLTGSSEILYTVVDGDENGTFKIVTDEHTNRGFVRLSRRLDFETHPVYRLNISATNPEPLVTGVYYNTSSFTLLFVNVTDDDEPPCFKEPLYHVWISENASKGDFLFKVEAVDPEGGNISYHLTHDPRKWFKIDAETGEIFVNGDVDAEKERIYKMIVTAMEKDDPRKKSTVDIYVNLRDVNDNRPKLAEDTSSFFICMPGDEEKEVTIRAVDDDIELGPPFKFSLGQVHGKALKMYPINDTHASVTLKFGKHEDETQYKISVVISDSGTPPLQGNDFMTVQVCKCTDNKVCFIPVENDSSYSKVGLAVGVLLGTAALIALILLFVFLKMKPKKKEKTDPYRLELTNKEAEPLTTA
ncbi:cadherin-17 [Amblyraja radiata]|uniref:cadherin-17 n=1 Tax=Amblyraja radiata TaxID=386614 RepID=UPI001403B454|nr:cadherin-17 [Amblyraja radiata]